MRIFTLNCISGPLKGQTFRLNGGPIFIFGRYPKAHCSLAGDPAASHLHFLIDASEQRIRIIDLGSTNGLVINEKHMGGKMGAPFADFVTLNPGDTVLAGACLFRLTADDADAKTYAADAANANAGQSNLKAGALTTILPNNSVTWQLSDPGGKPAAANSPSQESSTASALPAIDGFTITGLIGGGGKGLVYKAIKNDTGVAAAIKMMSFNRVKAKKQRSLEMFRREIQITRQLQHPHIIRYIGDGISQGAPYLALEYVDGGTLDELIHREREKRLDLPKAVPLFIQLLEAVAYMHSRSLVHRDIKPKNVLLDLRRGGGMAVKLSDMGLSCRFSNRANDDFLPIVSEGGTPAYMPPEQLTDLTQAIPQSDVFSSAATLYQMLSGSLLYDFTGKEQNEAILKGEIKPILSLCPGLPPPIANVINKALSYQPDQRYATAQQMLDAFKQALA